MVTYNETGSGNNELYKLSGASLKFVNSKIGNEYGLTRKKRQKLVEAFITARHNIKGETGPKKHVFLAKAILSIPPDVKGDIVECGCYKGVSTAALSMICKAVGRKLLVCDSFEGLPDDGDQIHYGFIRGHYGCYKEGMFCGSIDEVKSNVEKYGCIESCEFVKGYFEDSLKVLKDPVAFAFLDVDLVSSTQDCLRYIWPLLIENGIIYTDDSGDMDVVRVFFDDQWWNETLGEKSPGLVGSGKTFGYTIKKDYDTKNWKKLHWLHYPE